MPQVSVILPVYNGEKFLREAIDSILAQTFTDFELLVMNDGSTDGSSTIIDSYTDKRLVHIKNDDNRGLIFTLNKAIDLAKGEYIARMDADDVALPERLQKQVQYLRSHANVGLVATTIQFINEAGKGTGVWKLDQKTITHQQIMREMARDCCIAHPSIMARREILLSHHYNPSQKHIEDYDLWLRLLAARVHFGKLKESALLYRTHSQSVTSQSNTHVIPRKRIVHCKVQFLKAQWKQRRFTTISWLVFFSLPLDFAELVKKSIFGKKPVL